MSSLDHLIVNNRCWARRMLEGTISFSPACQNSKRHDTCGSAARTAGFQRTKSWGLLPGEVFVHRNIANLMVHTDLNCLSVLQYAIEVLKVEHVMVVGHYGCGGIQAVAERRSMGLVDNWLRHVEDVAQHHATLLRDLPSDDERGRRLCELSVVEQVANVCRTTIVRRAWARGQRFEVHALVYDLCDGLLRPIGEGLSGPERWQSGHQNALNEVIARCHH